MPFGYELAMNSVLKRAKGMLVSAGPSKTEPPPKRKPNQYHAVSVVAGPQACAVARALADKRFISREAPPLPLAGCTQEHCDCRYAHHEDRRKGPRRASEMGVAVDGYVGRDKRSGPKRGRRKTDK